METSSQFCSPCSLWRPKTRRGLITKSSRPGQLPSLPALAPKRHHRAASIRGRHPAPHWSIMTTKKCTAHAVAGHQISLRSRLPLGPPVPMLYNAVNACCHWEYRTGTPNQTYVHFGTVRQGCVFSRRRRTRRCGGRIVPMRGSGTGSFSSSRTVEDSARRGGPPALRAPSAVSAAGRAPPAGAGGGRAGPWRPRFASSSAVGGNPASESRSAMIRASRQSTRGRSKKPCITKGTFLLPQANYEA